MDTNERKTGRKPRPLDFIVLTVMLFSAVFCVLKYRDINTLRQQKILAQETATALENDLRETDIRKTEKTAELRKYDRMEKTVQETKESYFALIKKTEEEIRAGISDKKLAYLTFDDGPYLLSEHFLDVLDEYDINATFFYLLKSPETGYAQQDEQYDHTYRRIIRSGHTLGNHTASHRLRSDDSVYQSVDYFMYDLLLNRTFIQERYGYTTTVMRFPGGSTTSSLAPQIKERLKQENYCYVDWNASTGDGGAVLTPSQFRDNVLNNTEGIKILVVLMHDYSQNTLTALPEIIEGLRDQGYIFVPMFPGSSMCR